uniref:C2 calcium dependent domain containing 4C n=1 Tax=Amphiprion percula TaxID=161767 RepID=A0A3P8T327_AMPPE
MWLLEKLRSSVESSGTQSQPPQTTEAIVYANVLTPDKIPDFFIPPKLICCPPEDTLTQNPRTLANRHIIQIESADEPGAGSGDKVSVNVNTNADPQSQTAMSLPYVPKAQTSYGFSTLVESPHTRRKESLFHSNPSSPLTSPNSQRRSQGGTLLAPADPNPYRYFSGGESDTLFSLFDSNLLPDNSPNMQRRRMRCPPSPAFRGCKSSGLKGAASDLLQREHTINLHKGGTLRLSTHYDPEAARLRVRVLAAEALYDRQTDIKSINCCVALYLNPGKQQKQRSTIIKNSRNPVFNEDFFFDVVNKGTSLKRDVLLGEREVLLSELLTGL